MLNDIKSAWLEIAYLKSSLLKNHIKSITNDFKI